VLGALAEFAAASVAAAIVNEIAIFCMIIL